MSFHIQSIQDIKYFVEQHPEHPISTAWQDMLTDMNRFGEEWSFEGFVDEAEEQASDGNLSSYDLEQLFE